MKFSEVTAERAIGSMPVDGNRQIIGLLHGGASAALAETVGSMAAAVHAGPGGHAVGMELNITHQNSATEGEVHAVASALRLGKTSASYDIRITDDAGNLVANARLLCRVFRARD